TRRAARLGGGGRAPRPAEGPGAPPRAGPGRADRHLHRRLPGRGGTHGAVPRERHLVRRDRGGRRGLAQPDGRARAPLHRPLHRPILHHSYGDISDHLHSLNKLTAVAAEQPRLPRRVGAWRLIGEPAWRFVRAYLVRGGVRDGFPGLFVAATGAFYVFLRWAKVRERRARERAGAA